MIIIMENKLHFLQCALLEAGDVDALRAFNVIRTKWWTENRPWETVRKGEFEQDRFDSSAKVVVLIHEGVVIGGCRLIKPDENGFLPVVDHSNFDEVPTHSLEISRWCISRDAGIPGRVHYAAHELLITGTEKYFLDNGLTSVYTDVCEFLFLMVTKTKGKRGKLVEMFPCGDLHEYKNSSFQPARLDVGKTAILLGLVALDKPSKIASRA